MNRDNNWITEGNCRKIPVSDFFPGQGVVISERAVNACKDCPVKKECLDYALKHEAYGYWGGASEKERKRIRRELGISLESPQSAVSYTFNKIHYEKKKAISI